MSPARLTPWLIGATLAVLLGGVIGWALGAGAAQEKSDAQVAREAGYEQGYSLAFRQARKITATRGMKAGASRGKRAGARTGAREGASIGAGNSTIERAVDSQKSAEAAESAADSEIAARSANCGVVPAAPSWCPTSSELSAYDAAVRAAREAAEEAKEKQDKAKKEAAENGRP